MTLGNHFQIVMQYEQSWLFAGPEALVSNSYMLNLYEANGLYGCNRLPTDEGRAALIFANCHHFVQ